MSDESDYSFEYEDDDDASIYGDDSYIDADDAKTLPSNNKNNNNSENNSKSADLAEKIPAVSGTTHDLRSDLEPETTRGFRSPNQLSTVVYRPLSITWYIHEHMVGPGRLLQQTYLPQFSVEEAVSLLHYKKWSVDEVTSDFFDNWPRLRDAVGLTDTRGASPHHVRPAEAFTCMICCESGNLDVFSLSCCHEYCTHCYKRYVQSGLSRGALLRCIDTQCRLSLSYADIAELMQVELPLEEGDEDRDGDSHVASSDAELSSHDLDSLGAPLDDSESQYDYLEDSGAWSGIGTGTGTSTSNTNTNSSENYNALSSNPLLVSAARVSIDASQSKYRWCPSVDCTSLVEYVSGGADDAPKVAAADSGSVPEKSNDLARIAIVTCTSNHQFCFNCHYENHLPCPCWVAKAWVKRCEDDSETVNWIEANTQGCPKCSAVIEKNGGCNHMSCPTCTHEFCWICLGDWRSHNSSFWQCNRFDPKQAEEIQKKRTHKQNSLSRYLHFYRRFSVHQVSMKGDKETLRAVHRCMHHYMKAKSYRTQSWNDLQFLTDAIRSLSSGRKTLMWTYAFAFYLNSSNYSEIFESMQDYLNETVESLSRLFEQIKVLDSPARTAAKISTKKSEIKELASRVNKRRDLLIESAQTGLLEQRLSFREP